MSKGIGSSNLPPSANTFIFYRIAGMPAIFVRYTVGMRKWNRSSFVTLFLYIFSAEAAGILGTIFMGGIDPWYQALNKPFFNPPDTVFGPVWIVLYALMGIAAYFIWQVKGGRHPALNVYWVQLALNALWTPIFFGAHSLSWSLIVILSLLVMTLETTRRFAKVRFEAALLMLPYVLWASFASILNFSLWYLN